MFCSDSESIGGFVSGPVPFEVELAMDAVFDDGCAYRKLSPSILVMQSTQNRTRKNASRCLGGT
jgi:hypothetical protein